jgi:hypothetical protein
LGDRCGIPIFECVPVPGYVSNDNDCRENDDDLGASACLPLNYNMTIDAPGNPNDHFIRSRIDPGDEIRAPLTGTLPDGGSVIATQMGATSRTQYELSNRCFHVEALHIRTGTAYQLSDTRADLTFSVDQDIAYQLSGAYQVINWTTGLIVEQVWLHDVFGGSLFDSHQVSMSTLNETFNLGTLGDGDSTSNVTPSRWGVLLAGHLYEFHAQHLIQEPHILGSPFGATALGYTQLTFAPDPGTLLGLIPGIVLLALLGRADRDIKRRFPFRR